MNEFFPNPLGYKSNINFTNTKATPDQFGNASKFGGFFAPPVQVQSTADFGLMCGNSLYSTNFSTQLCKTENLNERQRAKPD